MRANKNFDFASHFWVQILLLYFGLLFFLRSLCVSLVRLFLWLIVLPSKALRSSHYAPLAPAQWLAHV